MSLHELDLLLQQLEGTRTLIVYDNLYALGSLLSHHIAYYYSSKKTTYVVMFFETTHMRAKKLYEQIRNSKIREILNDVKVVKIGIRSDIPFGKLYAFIHKEGNWLKELTNTLRNINGRDVICFLGITPCIWIFGDNMKRNLLEMYEAIPEGVTTFCEIYKKTYDRNLSDFMDILHDVVLYLKRCEGFVESRDVYAIEIIQSIIGDFATATSCYYEIGEDLRLHKVEL